MNNLVLIRLNRVFVLFPPNYQPLSCYEHYHLPALYRCVLYIFRSFRLKKPLNIPKNGATTNLKTKLRTDDGELIIPK